MRHTVSRETSMETKMAANYSSRWHHAWWRFQHRWPTIASKWH